uniref:Zinc finger HIT domain-containing protein 1 n=1 Tax=Sander lucioperca TaxID=283035 RepID=A0A8D0CQI5_SANLU
MVLEKKASARVEAGQRRVLDEATRQRRLTRQLEALEKDNFQDDPLSSLPPPGPTARLPAFSETEEPEKKKRKTRGDHFKQRFRKNFTTLLEEENLSERAEPNYLSAAAPPFFSAPPSLLLRLRLPVPLHLQHLWGALLLQTVFKHTQRDKVFEVDSLMQFVSSGSLAALP